MADHKTKLNIKEGSICMPGQKLCLANEYFEAGKGAYEFGSLIFASVVGVLTLEEFPEHELTVVSVVNKNGKPPFSSPYVGAIVTCTVISRTDRFAKCIITDIGDVPLREGIRGIIRKEYITFKHRDEAEIEKSFDVGDNVLARVVGIGDGDFIMSTAEDSLGVATSISPAGYYMVPIGWDSMECPKTKLVYPKKVAKIVQDKNVAYWHERNASSKLKKAKE